MPVRKMYSVKVWIFAMIALIAGPLTQASAQPPMLRGIDVATVLTMRDQVRAVAVAKQHQNKEISAFSELKTIVIDPGHGGDNQGAIGTAHVHEKFLTLDLAFALRDQIQEKYPTARVILTRYWDKSMSLSDRIALANEEGADLFLSLHYNAAVHQKAIGVETYFLSTEQAIPDAEPAKSEPIASAQLNTTGLPDGVDKAMQEAAKPQGTFNDDMLTLQRDLARATQHERSGLLAEIVQKRLVNKTRSLNRGVKQANFGVLRGALMPAIVVESGFVTHPKEGRQVVKEDHRQRVVDALILAIEDFDDKLAEQNAR